MSLLNLLNKVFFRENIGLLEQIDSESIDLIYIDPPFFTQSERRTDSNSYSDIWTSLKEYLDYMSGIISECHRILKLTGTFICHCDYHASHYLKVLSDDIFEMKNFRNEIFWKRTLSANESTKKLGVLIDSLLYYTKSNIYTFNPLRVPLNEEQLKRYKYIEKDTGRKFTHYPLLKEGNKPKKLIFNDRGEMIAPNNLRFIWNQKTFNEKVEAEPNIIYWQKNNIPRYKKYLDTHKGILLDQLWLDIPNIAIGSKEWLGYPTQKPEKLLKRILRLFSNEGDIVADFFCGSGTTLAVAKKLRRKWIGCDRNPRAVEITEERLSKITTYADLMRY